MADGFEAPVDFASSLGIAVTPSMLLMCLRGQPYNTVGGDAAAELIPSIETAFREICEACLLESLQKWAGPAGIDGSPSAAMWLRETLVHGGAIYLNELSERCGKTNRGRRGVAPFIISQLENVLVRLGGFEGAFGASDDLGEESFAAPVIVILKMLGWRSTTSNMCHRKLKRVHGALATIGLGPLPRAISPDENFETIRHRSKT